VISHLKGQPGVHTTHLLVKLLPLLHLPLQ
jgi:hypothetical protein